MRELLINVSKHAGVSSATLECRRDGSGVVIAVEDAGVGFVARFPTDFKPQGLGLQSVRERLGYIGGTLHWITPAGGGTRAVIVAPLESDPMLSEDKAA